MLGCTSFKCSKARVESVDATPALFGDWLSDIPPLALIGRRHFVDTCKFEDEKKSLVLATNQVVG